MVAPWFAALVCVCVGGDATERFLCPVPSVDPISHSLSVLLALSGFIYFIVLFSELCLNHGTDVLARNFERLSLGLAFVAL